MILEMKVPSPGESISEVEIAEWLVKDGDFVEKDQTIAEVDSDKATLDLPAEESGVITLKAEEGDAVAVGQVVCLIDTGCKFICVISTHPSKEEHFADLSLEVSNLNHHHLQYSNICENYKPYYHPMEALNQ